MPEVISTERLELRAWSEEVRNSWIALNSDARVYGRLGTGAPLGLDLIEKEFDWMLDHWERRGFGWRSVVDRSTGEWLGAVGLAEIGDNPADLPPDDIEIGWWLKPEHWGRGLATEGAAATRDEGFNEGLLDHFWARHNARNPASGRIMEKVGMTFVRDGTGVAGVPIRVYEMDRDRWMSFVGRPGERAP